MVHLAKKTLHLNMDQISAEIPPIICDLSLGIEGDPSDKFTQALALLLHQIYSSYWGQMKDLDILFELGYGSLDSTKE